MLEVLACVLGLMGSLEADAVDGTVYWEGLDWAPPSGVRSWTLGEGMSEVLLSSFPPVLSLILDVAKSGGRRFAAGTRAAEAPPVLAGDG